MVNKKKKSEGNQYIRLFYFFVYTFDLILKITKWNLQPHLQDINELNEIGFRTCTALPP